MRSYFHFVSVCVCTMYVCVCVFVRVGVCVCIPIYIYIYSIVYTDESEANVIEYSGAHIPKSVQSTNFKLNLEPK